MFQNLVRRISGTIFRPDQSWNDDATSNAPQIGRKRRLSATEHDEESHSISKKRSKPGELAEGSGDASVEQRDESESPPPVKETEAVKEIRKGVREVELEDKTQIVVEGTSEEDLGKAAAIPLPEYSDDLKKGSQAVENEDLPVKEPSLEEEEENTSNNEESFDVSAGAEKQEVPSSAEKAAEVVVSQKDVVEVEHHEVSPIPEAKDDSKAGVTMQEEEAVASKHSS